MRLFIEIKFVFILLPLFSVIFRFPRKNFRIYYLESLAYTGDIHAASVKPRFRLRSMNTPQYEIDLTGPEVDSRHLKPFYLKQSFSSLLLLLQEPSSSIILSGLRRSIAFVLVLLTSAESRMLARRRRTLS